MASLRKSFAHLPSWAVLILSDDGVFCSGIFRGLIDSRGKTKFLGCEGALHELSMGCNKIERVIH